MNEETQKTIEEQMAVLPEEIKTILAEFDWAGKANELGQKHKIHIDQLGTLQTEILMVLIGIIPPDEFENELKANLHLPPEKISEIIKDANEMIFKPVRQSLVDIYEGVLTDEDVAREKTGEEALKEAGVEVLEASSTPGVKEVPTPGVFPATPVNIAAQKLSASFRIPKQETDLSLIKKNTPATSPAIPAAEATSKIDPYREKPI